MGKGSVVMETKWSDMGRERQEKGKGGEGKGKKGKRVKKNNGKWKERQCDVEKGKGLRKDDNVSWLNFFVNKSTVSSLLERETIIFFSQCNNFQ